MYRFHPLSGNLLSKVPQASQTLRALKWDLVTSVQLLLCPSWSHFLGQAMPKHDLPMKKHPWLQLFHSLKPSPSLTPSILPIEWLLQPLLLCIISHSCTLLPLHQLADCALSTSPHPLIYSLCSTLSSSPSWHSMLVTAAFGRQCLFPTSFPFSQHSSSAFLEYCSPHYLASGILFTLLR